MCRKNNIFIKSFRFFYFFLFLLYLSNQIYMILAKYRPHIYYPLY